jgi:acyl-coenzyme A thioesterase 13
MSTRATLQAPFMTLVGPVAPARLPDGGYELSLPIEPRHANAIGAAHGGLLATLADLAIGNQLAHATGQNPGITVSLAIDYLAPARIGDLLTIHAYEQRHGGRLGHGRAELYVGGTQVASAHAWFSMRGSK